MKTKPKRNRLHTAVALALAVLCAVGLGLAARHALRPRHRIVEGYAASTRQCYDGDQMSLDMLRRAGSDLLQYRTVLVNHNEDMPVGKVLQTELRGERLWVRIEISQSADLIWSLIREGVLTQFSVKAYVFDAEYDFSIELDKPTRLAKRGMCFDVSVVSSGSNPDAVITRVVEE